MSRRPPSSPLFPSPTLSRSPGVNRHELGYDMLGRVASYKNPAGDSSQYEYGALGTPQANLLQAINYPGGLAELGQYDQRGRRTSTIRKSRDGESLTLHYSLDSAGQTAAITSPGGTTRSEEHTSELQSPRNLVCR